MECKGGIFRPENGGIISDNIVNIDQFEQVGFESKFRGQRAKSTQKQGCLTFPSGIDL